MTAETYGQLIARLRDERKWTQTVLAQKSGVPKRTIQDVEADRHGRPHRTTRLALNTALDIEGDPSAERAEWDDDVKVILDIIGAYLMKRTPQERRAWLHKRNSEFTD